MKVKFGDLRFKIGTSIRESAIFCANEGTCDGCEYRNESVECQIVPQIDEGRENLEKILNYEITVPEVPALAESEDTEQNSYKKVYICSPYRGYTLSNTEAAQKFCKWAVQEKRVMPVAPHIYFTRFLDDDVPEQRDIGMNMGIQWLRECSEIWVLGETLSDGMARELTEAARLGMPIRFFAKTDNSFVERGTQK